MQDYSKECLEQDYGHLEPLEVLNFCLGQLYKDHEKCMGDEVADRLTYEELIGALLAARDRIEEAEIDAMLDNGWDDPDEVESVRESHRSMRP